MINLKYYKGSVIIIVIWMLFFIMGSLDKATTFEVFCGKSDITFYDSYRLLIGGLLRHNFFHLVVNSIAVLAIAECMDQKLGTMQFVIIFTMGTVLTSSFASFILNANGYIGGSLGIFAIIGYICMERLNRKIGFNIKGRAEQWLICIVVLGSLISLDTLIFHCLSFMSGVLIFAIVYRLLL